MVEHDAPIMYGGDEWIDEGDDRQGVFLQPIHMIPRTRAISKIERLIAGVSVDELEDVAGFENSIIGAATKREGEIEAGAVHRMPSDILAMMKLAESFSLLEGDVYQILTVPIDLGLTKLRITSKDEGVQKHFQELYKALDMEEMIGYNWHYCALYGQSFPVEVYDGKTPQAIMHLNPKRVHIGQMLGFGRRPMELEVDEQLREVLKQQDMPMKVYDSWTWEFNEFMEGQAQNITLDPDAVSHLHVRKLPHNRYAIPPIARAYRTLSTKQVLDEMIRATIEGLKSQLWLFKKSQGEKFMRGEVGALEAKLQSTRGDRTGYLVWPDLEVEVFIPKAIDSLLSNEKWLAMTQHIFRQLGVNIYLVSGERIGTARGDPKIDVQMFMERVNRDRDRQLRWTGGFNDRYVEKQNSPAMEKSPPTVGFELNVFEKEGIIRDRIAPLASFGYLSSTTALEESGYDYDVELARKQKEAPDRVHFMPQPSFAQISPGGRQVESDSTKGRRPDAENPDVLVKASIEDYSRAISRSFQDVKKAKGDDKKTAIAAFIATLMLTNWTQMTDAYRRGYFEAGGRQEPMEARMLATVAWNNDYARNFERDMLSAVEAGEDLLQFEDRAGMYSPAGWQKAYMAGVFQAKKYEQNYTGWRRVLHPELSQSGVCEWCLADSLITHPIEEEFFDHCNGVCSVAFLTFYRGEMSSYPMRIPELTTRPSIGTISR